MKFAMGAMANFQTQKTTQFLKGILSDPWAPWEPWGPDPWGQARDLASAATRSKHMFWKGKK